MSADERFMQLALEAARQGEGLTRPNPPVGAVLVREEKVFCRRDGMHLREAITRSGRV